MPMTRPLAEDVLHFRLEDERRTMTDSEPFARGGRSARTLVKDGPLRVTLIALAAGSRIAEHRAAGPVTIQPVQGSIRVEARGQVRTLHPGELLALGAGVEHAVAAGEPAAFLLTVAAPAGA